LLARVEIPDESGGQATTSLEDYKEVDGVKIPHTIRSESPAISLVIKFTEVQHGVDIDEAKFAKPAN